MNVTLAVTALLIGILVVTTITDIRWQKIYNATTYPGMAAALLLSGIATWLGIDAVNGTQQQAKLLGVTPLDDALLGWLACGGLMLVCYVFFPGGVGGGDVKLIAMMGAFLGIMSGLEALLWTFVVGACLALVSLVWRFGFWTLMTRAATFFWYAVRSGGHWQATDEERQPLRTKQFLSPAALVAVLIVRLGVLQP